MIIVKIPFRLPLGGGGTDLPAYYKNWECQLLTATINKFMYVSINKPIAGNAIKLYYKYTESVDPSAVGSIKHDIIRETLKLYYVDFPLEIGSMAEIDAQTGMGSSSAFTVALLAGLNALKHIYFSPMELAELACHIEMDLVGKPIGKQDQYATALGGINQLNIDKKGKVTVNPLILSDDVILEIENRLVMFVTPITRDANVILGEQSQKISSGANNETNLCMHEIKRIGIQIKDALISGDMDLFGNLLNEHWITKKKVSKEMSNVFIDRWYDLAMANGALGGKIMGAGGGGLFLFCVENGKRKQLRKAMEAEGLKNMDFRFEFNGVKILNL
jgi:D-glycero-alpha-D-manno-heptose-7-phosphate kinase